MVSEEVAEREREIREGNCDYKLKITVAVAEFHMINQWDIKILQRLKLHSSVKCGGKRTSRPH